MIHHISPCSLLYWTGKRSQTWRRGSSSYVSAAGDELWSAASMDCMNSRGAPDQLNTARPHEANVLRSFLSASLDHKHSRNWSNSQFCENMWTIASIDSPFTLWCSNGRPIDEVRGGSGESSRIIVDQQGFLDITQLNVRTREEYVLVDSDLNYTEVQSSPSGKALSLVCSNTRLSPRRHRCEWCETISYGHRGRRKPSCSLPWDKCRCNIHSKC